MTVEEKERQARREFFEESMFFETDDGDLICYVVDTETGEMTEKLFSEIPPPSGLKMIANDIRRAEAWKEQINDYKKAEIDRIRAESDARIAMIDRQIDAHAKRAQAKIEALADEGLAPVDKKNRAYYDIPGIGKFSYRKGPATIDREEWDNLSKDEQEQFKNIIPIREKYEWNPDVTEIKKKLKEGENVPHFRLNPGTDTFKFKGVKA